MAVTSNLFESVFNQMLAGNIKWEASGGDSIKMALLTSSASPSLSSWVHYSDLTNEVANGNGYTTGGVALSSLTATATAANSWGTSWAATTAYTAGQVVIPSSANGYLYVCVVAGTSGSSAPSWPTVQGETVVDSGVTWSCIGESVSVYSSAAASWTSATFSAEYGVIYDSQSGTGSTEPLIALINFGATLSPSAGTFTVTPPSSTGWFWIAPA